MYMYVHVFVDVGAVSSLSYVYTSPHTMRHRFHQVRKEALLSKDDTLTKPCLLLPPSPFWGVTQRATRGCGLRAAGWWVYNTATPAEEEEEELLFPSYHQHSWTGD